MKKLKWIVIALVVLCLAGGGAIVGINVYASVSDNTICKGISIASVDVGGMREEEAEKAVTEYVEALKEKTFIIKIDKHEVKASAQELGYDCSIEDTVSEAMNFGKKGNLIKRYKEIKDLEKKPMTLDLTPKIDKDKLKDFVETKCTKYDVEPKNAKLSRKNGVFEIKDHVMGRKLVAEDTVEKLMSYMKEDWDYKKAEVEAVVMEKEPEYTSEKLGLCKDVLGTFSTTYASSSASRANNLANGARLIDGSIVWPGEEFSTGEAMSPITAENGYSMASAYSNGQVVDSIGGGVCQVATTLYNALLLSELEIVERANHSMIVGYVEPSMDAAIAGSYKDLKFKNDTDVPVYIEASTEGRTITFTIYGHETRDLETRSIKYESKVLATIQPGAEKITEDSSLPAGYRRVTQSAHVGYRAELWKIVYENGAEVSREQVNSSTYAAEPAYVTVGTKGLKKDDDKKDDDKDKDDKDKKDENKDDKDKEDGTDNEQGGISTPTPKPSKDPKPTKEPEATKTPKPTETPAATPKPTAKPTKEPEATQEPTDSEGEGALGEVGEE